MKKVQLYSYYLSIMKNIKSRYGNVDTYMKISPSDPVQKSKSIGKFKSNYLSSPYVSTENKILGVFKWGVQANFKITSEFSIDA